MANNINDIVAKMGGQNSDEFVTETELTDRLYKIEIELEDDCDDPEICKKIYQSIQDKNTKELCPIINRAFSDKLFLEYKGYILDKISEAYSHSKLFSIERTNEFVNRLKDELIKRHTFDKHYFTLKKKYNSKSIRSLSYYNKNEYYSIDNIEEILNVPFALFCDDMNIPSDVRYVISSAIDESILRNKHGFADVSVNQLNATVRKAKDYSCDSILSVFFEFDTTLEDIINKADIKLTH
jgi:hypothetical protein